MMKKVCVSVIFAGLMFVILGAAPENDLQLLKLKGRVEYLDNGQIAQYFTEEGYLDWEEYECGKSERACKYYNRDEQGRVTYIKDEGTDTYTTNSYDQAGNLVEQKVESGQGTYSIRYSHNSKGEVTWLKVYDQAGTLTSSTENSYDEMGNKIKTTDYDNANAITGYSEHEYDEQRNLTESREYLPPHELTGKTSFSYDSRKRILISTVYFYYEGESYVSTGYAYNDQDDVTQTTATYSTDGSTLITRYAYTYDSVGNWLTQEIWSEGEDEPETIERSIEYY